MRVGLDLLPQMPDVNVDRARVAEVHAARLDDDGADGSVLYKADAEGDWSWRGDDGAAYAQAFDVEAGAEDYAPLVGLLDLANNGTDEEFAAQLPELLDVEANTGMTLTESMAMAPGASVSGWYLSHPQSQYFVVGRLGRDQVQDYAARKGWTLAEAERWLSSNLAYDPED